jgi:hypothetical protein
MKRFIYVVLVLCFVVGIAAVTINAEIKNFISKTLVKEVVEQLSGNDWWLDNQYEDWDHLRVGKTTRVQIADDIAKETGLKFWDIFEDVYEQLREYFSDPDVLWERYSELKPYIIKEIKKNPKLVQKLKFVYDEEFLQHLAGKSSNKDYLSKRWHLMKEIADFQKDTGWNDEGYSEGIQPLNEEVYKLQRKHNAQESTWVYAYNISEKCGFAFDFFMRRKSEGGRKLAQTWVKIARDFSESL